MRIRSIRPEFWSSEDIAAMDWATRLIYIGLWSYVDDNGVGRDVERLILADLFPLDEDLSEASVRVHGALQYLFEQGHIVRYRVDGKPYLHVVAFNTHQKINRPSDGRYPLPTSADTDIHGALSEPSVSPPANVPLGEGEKGRRGEGEKGKDTRLAPLDPAPSDRLPAVVEQTAGFDEFWAAYPKKVDKRTAQTAWKTAIKRVRPQVIIRGALAYANDPHRSPQYTKNPTTWLRADSWENEALPPRTNGNRRQQETDSLFERAAARLGVEMGSDS